MLISNQTKAISKILGNNIDDKVKDNFNSLNDICSNIKNEKMNFTKKENMLKKIEIKIAENDNIDKFYIEDFDFFNAKQIYNLRIGLLNELDAESYRNEKITSYNMALKRLLLQYNKESEKPFDLAYLDKYPSNKVFLLFKIFQYNNSHEEQIDFAQAEAEFNIKNIYDLYNSSIENNLIKKEQKIAESKKREKIIVEKDISELSFGELADIWNEKHPNAKINSNLIWAQKNKKTAEMLYTTSIYNVVFKNKKVNLNIFIKDDFNTLQKEEILNGIKYNLSHKNKTIMIEKYINKEIPAENMKILSKIMRYSSENNSPIDIDFIIQNIKTRKELNHIFDQLRSSTANNMAE